MRNNLSFLRELFWLELRWWYFQDFLKSDFRQWTDCLPHAFHNVMLYSCEREIGPVSALGAPKYIPSVRNTPARYLPQNHARQDCVPCGPKKYKNRLAVILPTDSNVSVNDDGRSHCNKGNATPRHCENHLVRQIYLPEVLSRHMVVWRIRCKQCDPFSIRIIHPCGCIRVLVNTSGR